MSATDGFEENVMANKQTFTLLFVAAINTMVMLLMLFSFSSQSIAQESLVTVKDIDGNVYNTVVIGTQVWMKENLKTTKYNDGTSIPNMNQWVNLTTGAYSWYDNDAATYKTPYGALYNWYAVGTGKLCPTEWHVPSFEEWISLRNFLGGVKEAGGKMKETGTDHWKKSNKKASNESGFTALPGGYRDALGFHGLGKYAFFWSSGDWFSGTEVDPLSAWRWELFKKGGKFYRSGRTKDGGNSVRCIKDSD